MEQRQFEFSVVDSETAAKNMTAIFMQMAYSDGVFQKNISQKFVADLYDYLENQTGTPKSKFYSLIVLKDIVAKNDIKIIGLLSSSPQFFQSLQKIGYVDSKKPLSQKGKNMLPQDKEGYGNKIVNLVLQILTYLGRRFPKTSKSQPTRFKKILMKLQSDNVVLPQQLTYFPKYKQDPSQNESLNKNQPKKQERTNQDKKQVLKQQKGGSKQPVNFQALTRFVKFKIEEYFANLQQAEEVEKMQQIIIKTHEILGGELKKFNDIGDSIFQSNQIQTNPNLLEQYLKVREFLDRQSTIYQKQIGNKNQFPMYYDQIKISFEQLFGEPKSSKSKIDNKTREIKKTDSVTANLKTQYASKNSIQQNDKSQETRKPVEKYEEPKRNPSIIEKKQSIRPNNVNLLSKVFDQMEERSRSKSGFKTVLQNLQKQKRDIQAPPHSKVQRKSKAQLQSSNVSKSGLKLNSIFTNVPNSSPPFKIYQGELVQSNRQLYSILFDIKKEQSHRRFKVGNFKSKYPLFENDNIQIGFKSEPIFEQYDGFKTFLSIELYFGNKTNRQIKDLQISFQGDENCLIYTNPQTINRYIQSESQIKHGVMIIPNKIPFGFINMRVLYQCGSVTTRTTVALPTSIIKLSTLIQISKTEFSSLWPDLTHLYKTELFKLSEHIPPNSLNKYLPNLSQQTRYSQFALSGSVTDYQVFCLVDLLQTFEGLLKISIRPNLTAVIQIGGIEPNQQAINLLKFYLQTLQMLLQQTNQ